MQRAATITPAQIALVEKSFDGFYPGSYDAIAASFYKELFQRDPHVRALFPQDLHNQRRKLMMAFNMAVHGLRHPGSLRPALQRLGQTHTRLGIVPQQYTVVGEALLAAIQQHAGAGLSVEEIAAWQAAYAAIVEMMLSTEQAA